MSNGRMRDLGHEIGLERNGVNAHVIVVAVDRKKRKKYKIKIQIEANTLNF
jgi:hypothetical protein